MLHLHLSSKLTGSSKNKGKAAPIPPSSLVGVTKKPWKGVKRPRLAQGSESEEEEGEGYETQPRLPEWTSEKEKEEDGKKLHFRLPLKDRKGLIQQRPVVLEGQFETLFTLILMFFGLSDVLGTQQEESELIDSLCNFVVNARLFQCLK